MTVGVVVSVSLLLVVMSATTIKPVVTSGYQEPDDAFCGRLRVWCLVIIAA